MLITALAGIAGARGWSWRDKASLLRASLRWQLAGFQCPPETSVAELTRGLTPRVREDIARQLALQQPALHLASFHRPNLLYSVRPRNARSEEELLAQQGAEVDVAEVGLLVDVAQPVRRAARGGVPRGSGDPHPLLQPEPGEVPPPGEWITERPPDGPAGGQARAQAELWGDEQWIVLKQVIEERNPSTIAVNVSRVFAFSDGLTAGELEAMREALGDALAARIRPAEALPLELIATRLPEEEATFERMNVVAWDIIAEAFSNRVITPGVTRTDDVVWWMRQRLADLGLDTWFQPSVSVQRRGATDQQLGANPVIQRGDVLHCDFGVTALRLNTDTQHMGYVLRDGETAPPPGLQRALARSNRLQDIVVSELRPGRTGNEVLRASRERMMREGIDGTVYSHPVGLHGHGAGPLIGRWDAQGGVPGRGDAHVLPSTWYSIELQATSPVPEWDGQRVRSAQEEDVIIDAIGKVRWARGRQTDFHLVR